MGIIHNMYNFSHYYNSYHSLRLPEYDSQIKMDFVNAVFAGCSDFQTREICVGLGDRILISACWLDGTVSGGDVSEDILRPLTQFWRGLQAPDEAAAFNLILKGSVYSYSVRECSNCDELIYSLTHGHCALIFDDIGKALSFEVKTAQTRSISEPTMEKALKGARDSFVETLRINTSLVRRRIFSPKLKLIESTVGRKSNTRVGLMFVEGIADSGTVAEAAKRLDAMDIDGLLSCGILEEAVSDHPLSPFPQLIHTERPDRFSQYLMDGRVGILVDGIPFGLVLPVTFAEFMKVTGDSGMHFIVATGITLLRYIALLLGVCLPAFYVAVATYHQEMIPTPMLLSIIEAKKNVPFSTALEVLGMLMAFSLLQEAGLRLPNPIGDTVSIIGALIVGQSAVEAQVVSPIAIIVVALSGIACYTLPSQDMSFALKLTRLLLLLGAAFGGLYGAALVSCLVTLHLAGMDSFGVNYTAPVSDGQPGGIRRLLLKIPKTRDKYRDPLLNCPDKRRQK